LKIKPKITTENKTENRTMSRFVSRLTVVSLMAAFVLTTGFAAPSFAESKKKERLERRQAEAMAVQRGYYGMPPNYYPAPPFPFFLLPGPWWLPAHP
jgi:hypothetical protein